jgi:uncharacterized protein YjaZ
MKEEIQFAAEKALAKAKSIFNVDDVLVEIKEDPNKVILETGVGGYTPNSHTIFVYYDSTNKNFRENPREKIKSTVTHEFHHAVRNRTYNWKEDTLLGAMITEGLADHFDIEVNGGEPKPWSVVLKDVEIERIKVIANPEFNSREYNHSEWFFGSQERNIPRWAGYAIGFKLVDSYLKKSGKKASELVAEPAKSFLD